MYVLAVGDTVMSYPYSVRQLREAFPNVSFPKEIPDERLAEWSVFPVALVTPPAYDINFNITEGTPIKVADVWTQVWETTPVDPAVAAQRLRTRKAGKVDALRTERAARMNADLTVGAKTLDITDDLRTQVRELKEYSDANPGESLQVLTPKGKTATVTRAQLLAVHSALVTRTKAVNAVAAVKADAIDAATTVAELDAIDLTTGWPA